MSKEKNIQLAVETAPRTKKNQHKKIEWIPRATDTTRKDIMDWRRAVKMAENSDDPSNAKLQNIYEQVMNDALLTSQAENRQSKLFNIDFYLRNTNGDIDETQTAILNDDVPYREIITAILETIYYEYSMLQLDWKTDVEGQDRLIAKSLPRPNIVPQTGMFYYDLADPTKHLKFREEKEYGIWWLEFGDASKRGLLNKAVPHILMKSFAQSCWAELCEIYGIPPRYIKTNTQDKALLNRAERMMKDMGAAAWFIIDETEEFKFAEGVSTNGDVYRNLIKLCNNETSLLVSGAIIGQDTENGNYSKEQSSREVLDELVMRDIVLVENNWNNIVIPALKKIGILQGDIVFKYDIPEDLEALWEKVKDAMNNYEFDTEWLNEKFGLKITGVKQTPSFGLSMSEDFFA